MLPFAIRTQRIRAALYWFAVAFVILTLATIQITMQRTQGYFVLNKRDYMELTRIIVITPTYRRSTRMADLTRMANTLSHISNLHWIVVEDGNLQVPAVGRLLNRTSPSHTYLAMKTKPGYPRRGWYQRNMAIEFLRGNRSIEAVGTSKHAVVYFGDDDNSYDVRLFNDYIRNVRKVGIWAVGLVGGALIEAPKVENDTVVGWNVGWNKQRKFATDMAGFAVSLDTIQNSTALFGTSCKRGGGAPETCLLEDLGLTRADLEPFGFKETEPRRKHELVVWHTKTSQYKYDKKKLDLYGFDIE